MTDSVLFPTPTSPGPPSAPGQAPPPSAVHGPAPQPAPDDTTDPEGTLVAVQAALHDLMNLIQPIVGLTELLALRPAVTGDPVAAGHVRDLLAAGEATIARVGELRRLTAAARHPGGAAFATPPGGRR